MNETKMEKANLDRDVPKIIFSLRFSAWPYEKFPFLMRNAEPFFHCEDGERSFKITGNCNYLSIFL